MDTYEMLKNQEFIEYLLNNHKKYILSETLAQSMFDEMLDDTNEPICLETIDYDYSFVLYNTDEILYNQSFLDYMDNDYVPADYYQSTYYIQKDKLEKLYDEFLEDIETLKNEAK